MFALENLNPVTKKRKRVGRGGSRGGTAGRGHKGQKARSGGKVNPRFEGGQMPLYRRLPKRGFTNAPFREVVETVNVDQLNAAFEDGALVTKQELIAKKIIKPKKCVAFVLKVLGNGVLKKKLTITADAFSENARQAIQSAGGTAQLTTKE
jgi:large subunit ribosomal protein L15